MVKLFIYLIVFSLVNAIDIIYYANHYDTYLSGFPLASNDISFTYQNTTKYSLTNLKVIKHSLNKNIDTTSIAFINAKFSYIFNVKISLENGLIIQKSNMIVEHTFDMLLFSLQADNTFLPSFINEQKTKCLFHLFDVFDVNISDDSNDVKQKICLLLGEEFISNVRQYVQSWPLSADVTNFWSIIIGLENKANYNCQFRLDETHVLLDLDFNQIKFKEFEKLEKKTKFKDVIVSFSYSIMNDYSVIRRETREIVFDYMIYGNDAFEFSSTFKGRKEFVPLLINVITEYVQETRQAT